MQYFNENNKKLLVVDVHPTWSGPCEALYPVYRYFRDDGIVELLKAYRMLGRSPYKNV